MNTKLKKGIIWIAIIPFVLPTNLLAFSIKANTGIPVQGSFVVGPAKSEITLLPGETKSVTLQIQNRMGRTQTFVISFEDFSASKNLNETVELGIQNSKTSLSQFMSVEKKEFTLNQGDELTLPVTISLPANANPGGKFGAVVVSAVSKKDVSGTEARAYSGATVISRIASLVFVTVSGDTKSEGVLTSFATKNNKTIFFSSEIPVRLVFQNTGNVNLNPYGIITVRDTFGSVLGTTELDPWFALPDSLRTRDVTLHRSNMFGKYSAHVAVNRGYGNVIDEKEITFYVFPPFWIAVIIISLILVIIGARKFVSRKKAVSEIIS